MKDWQVVIGLEIHIELKTASKMFCQCSANYFNKEPNTQVCPVCLGLPGALPVPNKKAIEWTILIGKALNCKISPFSKFDRKHYFYPDLPKGYQISQYDQPIAFDGFLTIDQKKFRIRRVHLEEDTAKLIHTNNETLIDFNRSGVPLVEIVTEPDFNNSDDVKAFLEELHTIIRYLDVSDADLEKGSMRFEPNISLYKVLNYKSSSENNFKMKNLNLPKYKIEVKNINSFRFVKYAIDYEVKRQIKLLNQGKIPIQETRGFDAEKKITFSQRTKEEAYDYRYFPEPDIPPLVLDKNYINSILIPELPEKKIKRYIKDFAIRKKDAFILTRNKKTAEYFEQVLKKINKQKIASKIDNLNQMIANLIVNKKISTKLSTEEFINRLVEILSPKKIDDYLLNEVIEKVLKNNQKAVIDYKNGKTNALMFLVGQAMRELKGKAEAKLVKEKIVDKLS